jgi:hypothetical protein
MQQFDCELSLKFVTLLLFASLSFDWIKALNEKVIQYSVCLT